MIRFWTIFAETHITKNIFVMCLVCGIVYFMTVTSFWLCTGMHVASAGTKMTVAIYYHSPPSFSSVITAYIFQLYMTLAVDRLPWDNWVMNQSACFHSIEWTVKGLAFTFIVALLNDTVTDFCSIISSKEHPIQSLYSYFVSYVLSTCAGNVSWFEWY